MTGLRLVLRAIGVAFASALMFLVLAALNGGATAAAATQPAGLGDLLGGEDAGGSLLAPILEPVDDLVAPILDPATQPLTPVVVPVTDTVEPIVDTVVRPVAEAIAPLTDTISPVLDTVVVPVTDAVLVPVVDDVVTPVVAPIADVILPVERPVVDTVAPIIDVVIPPVTQPGTPPVSTPTTPVGSDAGSAAVIAAPVGIDSPAVAPPTVDATTPNAAAPASATTAVAPYVGVRGAEPVGRPAPTGTSSDLVSTSPGGWSAAATWFPNHASGSGVVGSLVSGVLSAVPSPSPTPGAPSTLLAVLTATAAAMLLLSRRVTTDVWWRSALVFSSVERPG